MVITHKYNEIVKQLPYKSSFLFVDNILHLNEEEVIGDYTLKKDAFFYEDHFAGNPITPGVIMTEIMVQIGLVVLGIHLITQSSGQMTISREGELFPLLTSSNVTFCKMVLPGEKVTVVSRKQYFRLDTLKCKVEMLNTRNEVIAKGIFSGMIKRFRHTMAVGHIEKL